MNKLEMMLQNKRNNFDPTFHDDMVCAKEYLTHSKWGQQGCPFFLEWPYLDIPSMLKDKIAKHALGIL
jgi:hypothetical protein